MNYDNVFSVYDYLKDHYEQILLKKEDGLILFYLYEKYKNKADDWMTNTTIYDAIYQVKTDMGNFLTEPRELTQQSHDTLKRLSQYFFESKKEDKTKQRLYKFSAFAIRFCENIEQRVHIRFNPSDVQKSIRDLYLLLKGSIHDDDEFSYWYRMQFGKQKDSLEQQLLGLKEQIEQTTQDLTEIIRNDAFNYEQKIDACSHKLSEIGNQAEQLRQAFSDNSKIQDCLDEATLQSFDFLKAKQEIIDFIHDKTDELSKLNATIQKIKPMVYRLTRDVDKKEYDIRLEKFMLYLFANSIATKRRTNPNKDAFQIEIRLPNDLPTFTIIDDAPKFTRIPLYEFVKEDDTIIKEAYQSETALVRQEIQSREKIRIKKTIDDWVDRIEQILIQTGSVYFTDFFYQILETENGDVEVGVKTASKLLKRFSNNKQISIHIENELDSLSNAITHKYPYTKIWKMELTYNKDFLVR